MEIESMHGRKISVVIAALSVGFLVSLVISPAWAGWLVGITLLVGLAAAAWIDTGRRIIPNWITYPMISFGVITNLVISIVAAENPTNGVGIQASLTGATLCFTLMLVVYLAQATGGGDVKLAAAIGAFLGPHDGLMAIGWCHLIAGIVAVIWMLSRVSFPKLITSTIDYAKIAFLQRGVPSVSLEVNRLANRRMPMAAFFALGVLFTQLGYQLW